MSRRFTLASLLMATALGSGCKVYDPNLLTPGACEGRRPPARPDATDDADMPELVFALRDVVLNQSVGGAWADIGFNLDGICTASPDFGHECEPPAGGRPQPDGNEGIDNTFGSDLYPVVEAILPGLEETARNAMMSGAGAPVLRVRGWNGMPNDPRVHVTITQGVVTVPGNPDGTQPDIVITNYMAEMPAGTPAPPPNWDGNDYTWARLDTFVAGNVDQPIVYDDNAYVADDVLVMNIPDRVEIVFATETAGVAVRLTGAIATGRFSADRMNLENVVVGGRWSFVDLLRTAENVGLCMGTTEWNALNVMLEGIMDVRSQAGTGGEGVECDALSIGVRFTGFRVKWAELTEGRPPPNICAELPDGGVPDAGMDAG